MTRGKVSVLGGSSRWVLKTSCFLHVDQVMGINKGWGISWGYNANYMVCMPVISWGYCIWNGDPGDRMRTGSQLNLEHGCIRITSAN